MTAPREMHEGAYRRMRELIRAWIDDLVIAGGRTLDEVITDNFHAITRLVEKQFAPWISDPPANTQVLLSAYRVLEAAGVTATLGKLRDNLDEPTRDRITDDIVGWWNS